MFWIHFSLLTSLVFFVALFIYRFRVRFERPVLVPISRQKMVIKITPKKETCRFTTPQKALQLATSFTGVESVALTGDDKMQVEVIGDGVDVVELMTCLRKKMGSAVIQSIGPPPEKKKPPEKKQEENKPSPPVVIYPHDVCTSSCPYPYTHYYCYPCPTEAIYCQDYSCTIL